MSTINYGKYFYYLISVILLFTGLFGIKRLITKADLPFRYSFENNKIFSEEHYNDINTGDSILSINGIAIKSIYQLETLLDGKSTGEHVEIEIQPVNNSIFKTEAHLTRYYGNLIFIIVSLLVGLSFWFTSVFLISKKYGQRSVTALYWILILFSVATMTTPGKYYPGNDWIAFVVRASHVASYFLGAIVFLHFTMIFPTDRTGKYRTIIFILYLFSVLYCIILVNAQLNSLNEISSSGIFIMEDLWILTEFFLLLLIIAGSINLYVFYRKISSVPERKKTEWIFWGLAAGVSPYLLLWLLPKLIGFNEIIPEEYLLIFLMLVPVFFTMAVVRYHVFEINVFIRNSLLYFSLTFIIVIIYLISISAVTFFANDLTKEYSSFVSIFIILMIAFILNPLRDKLRNFIDRIFYRQKYNFEKTVSDFSAGIKDQNTISSLSRYVISEIEKIIPVKKIALIASSDDKSRISILSQNHFSDLNEFINEVRTEMIRSVPEKILAQTDKTESGIITDTSLSDFLKKWDLNIVIPFIPEPKDTAGALLLGDKLSGMVYTRHDIEILNVLISNIALAYKKLQLQKKLVLEELEISRLEEINKMMNYYVSSVSHDLKTPLTSIKMFTEILKEQNNFKSSESKDYLNIIEGESDRLSRLINNVLNYAKIENGIKEYSFGRMDLNECIEEVYKIMEYQFAIENFSVEKNISGNIFIRGDKDAVKEVLINVLTNAVKYSPDKKSISISSCTEKDFAVVKIKDHGIGIPQEEIKNIFKPFVRSKFANANHTGGAGIGLSIVKNIMDMHKGRAEVESCLGKGSTFSLYFRLSDSGKFEN